MRLQHTKISRANQAKTPRVKHANDEMKTVTDGAGTPRDQGAMLACSVPPANGNFSPRPTPKSTADGILLHPPEERNWSRMSLFLLIVARKSLDAGV
jgi:hypothetical protein